MHLPHFLSSLFLLACHVFLVLLFRLHVSLPFCFDCLPPGLIQSHTASETEIISCSGSYGSTGSRAKSVALFWAVFGSEVFPTFKRREERTAWCCSLVSAGLNKSCELWKARRYSLSWAVKGPSVLLRLFVCFRGSITCVYLYSEVLLSLLKFCTQQFKLDGVSV